jgi:hypothetical protein
VRPRSVGLDRDDWLEQAVVHVLGRSRAFLLELEAARGEIGLLHDPRSRALLDAMGATSARPERLGTLSLVERTARELLRGLSAGVEATGA